MIVLQSHEARTRILRAMRDAVQKHDAAALDVLMVEADQSDLLDLGAYIQAQKAWIAGDYTAAINAVDRAIALEPMFADAHLLKVAALIQIEKYETAVLFTNQAMQNLSLLNYAPFYANKGIAYERLGHLREARFFYLRAIADNEGYAQPYILLLQAAARAENWEESLTIARRVREVFAQDPLILSAVATSLLLQAAVSLKAGRTETDAILSEEAKRVMELAVTGAPADPGILYNAACAYARLGQRQEAVRTLGKALEAAKGTERAENLRKRAEVDVDFETIRGEEGFRALLAA